MAIVSQEGQRAKCRAVSRIAPPRSSPSTNASNSFSTSVHVIDMAPDTRSPGLIARYRLSLSRLCNRLRA